MSSGPNRRFQASPHVHARPFDDELVLLDLNGGTYYGLDELGAKLWVGLGQGKSPAEIADELRGVYAVDHDILVNDLVALADQLIDKGLLVARE